MVDLVRPDGTVRLGIHENRISRVNAEDYRLETPMGFQIPNVLKRLKFNQFVFIGIMGPRYIMGAAVVNLAIVGNGFVYLFDQKTGEMIEESGLQVPWKAALGREPEQPRASFSSGGLSIDLDQGRLRVRGRRLEMDLSFPVDSAGEPLRVCARAGYRGWVFTRKSAPHTIGGEVRVGGNVIGISSPEYLGLLDWSAGYMRRETFWNWAAIAGQLPDQTRIGLNLAAGVNETGFTENAFWVDGRMTKVDTVHFDYNPKQLTDDWRISSMDGRVALTFVPEGFREEKKNAGILASRFTQLMGHYSGRLITSGGRTVEFEQLPGLAEDHFARW